MNIVISSIEAMMINAQGYAKQGNIELMEYCLKPVYNIIGRLNDGERAVIDDTIKGIRVDAYFCCVKNYIDKLKNGKFVKSSIMNKHINNVLSKLKDLDEKISSSLESELRIYSTVTGQ